MKIIFNKACIVHVLTVCVLVSGRTLNRNSVNNESNEIPREPYKNFRQINQVTITAANIQSLLSSSPIVQAFLSNETVQTVLSDPTVQNVLRNPTVQSVLGNSILQNILFDPALQGLAMQTFLSSFTTTTTQRPTPPGVPPSPLTPFQPPNTTPRTPLFPTQPQSFINNNRPTLQNQTPSTQQIVATGVVLALNELLNMLQSQMVESNRIRSRLTNNVNGKMTYYNPKTA